MPQRTLDQWLGRGARDSSTAVKGAGTEVKSVDDIVRVSSGDYTILGEVGMRLACT